ncbi:BamA/TamA family outer membrane protein [Adhaeribacter swui]|uniref:BamA/TamA family outer membrane protein n=1 Tax=Adhaeribacter swui TaxID=2086471 RepID=A0A7G7GEL0_9BACT|nr:BamA/TamA family outer membrane protein [Adhaeribacter swui]QNF35594.1 BamA/TamA family outer membrane protein [Adhaeribacter swui]
MIRFYLLRLFVLRRLVVAASGLLLLVLASCSSTKTLPPGRKLYIGHKLELQSDTIIPTKKTLEPELESVITPKPNTSFLGIRPTLWINNIGNPNKKKGLAAWIRRKFGQEPVLLDSVKTKNVVSLLSNRLSNNGYFGSRVTYEVKEEKERMVRVIYRAQVSAPYRIKEIIWPSGDSISEASKAMAATQKTSLLKVGQVYNLNTLIAERTRIDGELKNQGFFFFGPDVIIFKADSMRHDRTINLYVQLKPETPARAKRAYRLNDISIFTDYRVGYETPPKTPPVEIQGYKYYPNELTLKAKRLLPSVFLTPDSLYTRRDHALTLSRLMGLGTFQYVDLKFFEVDAEPNLLNAEMRLTPIVNQSLRAEAEYVSKSNSFTGPGINLNYRHRNLGRGAELFVVTLNANQETQVGGSRKDEQKTGTDNNTANASLNSFSVGVTADLYIPRIISPIKGLRNVRSEFVPKTRFRVGANYMNRVGFFQMTGYNASYSYIWKPKATITHEFTPINLQYVNLARVSPEFQARLDTSAYLRQSFENQFILGGIYNFNYNDQARADLRNHFYFNANIDASGNLFSLVNQSGTLFNQAYAQYTRLDLDTRYYLKLTKGSMIAMRLLTGVGFTYGNSRTLPYVKQFFIGGPNSLRAFRSRAVGPGTYQDTSATSFFDQTGDIRFEANVEYRVDLFPYVKGALFVDAGNIWLSREAVNKETGQNEKQGAKFEPNKFFQQLAVGVGPGIRIDAQVIVLRFDVGFPLRIPTRQPEDYLPNEKPFPSPSRKPILNIAIGYPF